MSEALNPIIRIDASPDAGESRPALSIFNPGASLRPDSRREFLEQNDAKSAVALDFRNTLIRLASDYEIEPSGRKLSKFTDNQLLEILRHVSSHDRVDFARDMIFAALREKKVEPFLYSKLGKILHFTDTEERAELLDNLINLPKTKVSSEICRLILWTSRDMKELCFLVKRTGKENLLAFRNPEIRDLVAQAEIGLLLRKVQLPNKLASNANKIIVCKRIALIRETLHEALELCRSVKGLWRTETARDYAKAVKYDLAWLAEVKAHTRKVSELRAAVNLVIEKSKLQLKYKLLLSHERDKNGKIETKWSEPEIRDIKAVLRRIPEGRAVWTSKFYEIKRIRTFKDEAKDDPETLACRYDEDGLIEIANRAIGDKKIAAKYAGISSLRATFTHEFCHSLCDDTGDHKPSVIDLMYDFKDYFEISGWSGQRTGFRMLDGGDSFRLENDSEIHLIARPVVIDGKTYKFAYDKESRTLFKYDIFSDFSPGTYCRANPREDRAEAFTDYLLQPKRLLTYAPAKFLYFEEQFRFYDRDKWLQAARSPARMLKPGNRESPGTAAGPVLSPDSSHFMMKRFQKLDPIEQGMVIADLQAGDKKIDKAARTFDALKIFNTLGPRERLRRFSGIIAGETEDQERASQLLLEYHSRYFPALLSVMTAFERGEKVGLLTARGAPEANAGLISAIQSFVGYDFSPHLCYFVSDEKYGSRFRSMDTPERKYQILKEFALGYCIPETGEQTRLPEAFDQVVYYDNEDRNIDLIRRKLEEDGLTGKIIVHDARKLSSEEIWGQLMATLDSKSHTLPPSVKRMIFFDVDGTLLRLDNRMYLVDRRTGERYLELTHDDMARHPSKEYWIDKLCSETPGLSREELVFDLSDFNDPERITANLNEGLDGNRMFRL